MDSYTKLDLDSMCLITIDTQRDVLDGQPLEIPGTSQVLPAMRRLLYAFREARLPIVHIVRLYKADGSNADLCRKTMIESGAAILRPKTDGAELAAEILPAADAKLDTELLLAGGVQDLGGNEFVIYKPRWGAFFRTPLEEHLRGLGINSLVFSGCNFPNCPRTSIYEASERDFRVGLLVDAISGLYDRGRQELANIGVDLLTADALVAGIRDLRRSRERA